jgi:hypothetical protein
MATPRKPEGEADRVAGRKYCPTRFDPSEEDRKLVEMLSGFGIPTPDICTQIKGRDGKPIGLSTLKKYFGRELAVGHVKANAQVMKAMFKNACGKGPAAVTAQIWWTKNRMGWSDRRVLENTGPNGGPIKYQIIDKIEGRVLRLIKGGRAEEDPAGDDGGRAAKA